MNLAGFSVFNDINYVELLEKSAHLALVVLHSYLRLLIRIM